MGQRASKGSTRNPPVPSRAKGQSNPPQQESPVLNNVAAHSQYSNIKNTLRTAAASPGGGKCTPITTVPKSCAPYYNPKQCESCQVAPPGCRLHEAVGLRVRLPRNDSFAKSMAQVCNSPFYKEVNYTPVNMSRKSSSTSSGGLGGDTPFRRHHSRVYYDSDREHQISAPWSPALGPDGLYPARPVTVQGSPPPQVPRYANGSVPLDRAPRNYTPLHQGAGPPTHRWENGDVRNRLDARREASLVAGLSPVTPTIAKLLPSQHTPQNGAPPIPPSGPNTSTPKQAIPSSPSTDPRQRTSSSYCSLPYRGRYSSALPRPQDGATTPHSRLRPSGDGPRRFDKRSATLDRSSVRRRLPYSADETVRERGSASASSGRWVSPVATEVTPSNTVRPQLADPRVKEGERGTASTSSGRWASPLATEVTPRNTARPLLADPRVTEETDKQGQRPLAESNRLGVRQRSCRQRATSEGPGQSDLTRYAAQHPPSPDSRSEIEKGTSRRGPEAEVSHSRDSRHSSSSSSQKSSTSKELPRNEAPPVKQWLHDLRTLTDTECLTALQGKVLSKDSGLLEALTIGGAQETIETLRDRLELIMRDHRKCVKRLGISDWLKFTTFAADLCTGIKDLLRDFIPNSTTSTPSEKLVKIESQIIDACAMLMHIINSKEESALGGEKKKLLALLALLQDSLKHLVELLIFKGLTIIVERLDEGTNSYCVKRAIFALILLGQTGEPLCQMIAKVDGVRALLAACIENKWRHLQASALRALTVVCCVSDAVVQLEQAGGIECLTDILCDSKIEEPVRSEAAGLLAQITAPWMDSSSTALRGLGENIDKLIHSLTELVKNTRCSEVMLLATAALANLSFLDVGACDWMRKHETVKVLVSTCNEGTVANSFFIKDQVATVLANMAASGSCRPEVISEGGLVLLLNLLQVRPSITYNKAELAACERVQQKAAIAISRLCSDSLAANAIAEMKGIRRLVQLCKDGKERNNSDSVLVACLAALRKISTAVGMEEFKQLEASELVEPKLWDSFLIYSTKQESYV